MKRWISSTLLSVVTSVITGVFALTLTVDHAEAKRLGGGKSIGKQSNTVQQRQSAEPTSAAAPARQQTAQNANNPAANPAAAPASTRSKWLAPLAGLAAGLGIAALLSHFGLGEAFSSFIMAVLLIGAVILLISFLMRRFRKNAGYAPRYEPAYQYTGLGRETVSSEPEVKQSARFQSSQSAGGSAPVSQEIPADFDTETFVRNAKVYFVRLQAAFDACNTNDLREFTSPEMFAELSLQLSERGNNKQQTDIVTLQGQVLCVENQVHDQLASVRFTGMLREEAQQAAQPFDEVWNFSKPLDNSTGWVLAGIQQLS